MKYSFAGFSMIMVGLIGIIILIVFQDVTINNEGDYYSLKEAMEASLFESIDIPYYRSYESNGNIKIVEEKFIENFTRRFVKNTMGDSNGYVIEFYDIMESPPKASVIIKNKTDSIILKEDRSDFDIVNELTGILVSKEQSSLYCEYGYVNSYYYSIVARSTNDKTGKCSVSNHTKHNLNNSGQLLRAYSVKDTEVNYTSSYRIYDYRYSFYNVCGIENEGSTKYTGVSNELHDIYSNFVNYDDTSVNNNNICGYPYYKKQIKLEDGSEETVYAYPKCAENMASNFFEPDSNKIDGINFDKEFVYKHEKDYLNYYASDIKLDDIIINKADESQISEDSDGSLSASDDLYFISWKGTCERQNVAGGFCDKYYDDLDKVKDNVLMVLKVTWEVKKCPKKMG